MKKRLPECLQPARLLLFFALLALAAMPSRADSTGQSYRLSTLDHRLAAVEMQKICDDVAASRRCMVQSSNPGEVVVFGPEKVHAAIREMLSREDLALPAAFGFRIALLRRGAPEPGSDADPPEIARAVEGVEEMLGITELRVEDIGVIRMADRGSLRMVDRDGSLYDVDLAVSSVRTRHRIPEITLELEVDLLEEPDDSDGPTVLSSVVTVNAGETIVAGSSRGRGEKKIFVVLLTALPLENN